MKPSGTGSEAGGSAARAVNSSCFVEPASRLTCLKARGFSDTGAPRGDVPAGSILLRTCMDPAKLHGECWFTADEIAQVLDHFGRGVPTLAAGRAEGKRILQATMAVRHHWAGISPAHMGLAAAFRLPQPLTACHGEGDVAPDVAQTQALKPVGITDRHGRRRGARQVFLPECWRYQAAIVILEREVPSDTDLPRLVAAYNKGPLPFET